MTDQPKKTGPPVGTKYGPRHNEKCVPMVILKDQGGYGIATWEEQSTEEQCDWIKRYLYENRECCWTKKQKNVRKVKVSRWTTAHKKGELAIADQRAVQIYYEHFQLRHNLRERDIENAKLRERLDIEKKIYWDEVEAREKDWDENVELKKENERLKKQLEAMGNGVEGVGADLDKEAERVNQVGELLTQVTTMLPRLEKLAKDLAKEKKKVGDLKTENKELRFENKGLKSYKEKWEKWKAPFKGKKVKVQF